MRIALVHYWLLRMRGGEKVVESLCRLLPDADVFTLFYDPEGVSPLIRSHQVTSSFLNPLRRIYRSLLPLMPLALESLDLRGYDLIISSESGPAKGIVAPSSARHICYCHTPMRYLWDLYPDYLHEWAGARWKRIFMAPLACQLRMWDFATAARVDEFIANSENTKRRIWRNYRRDATVVHPPVPVETFYWKPAQDYYLIVSELVPYKRIDSAVRVFTDSGRRLKIAGTGPELRRLSKLAGPSVEFCGHVTDAELRELYAGCRALIMPGEEDFGLTAVEALSSGKPVIALGRGGSLESVPVSNPFGGILYDSRGDEPLERAIEHFEEREEEVRPRDLQSHAAQFSEARFHDGMRAILASGAGTSLPSKISQIFGCKKKAFNVGSTSLPQEAALVDLA
jgi:glycosyltransferase involved in cell wall biosynthesis